MNIYEIGALQGWPKSWVDQLLEIQPRSKVGAGFGDAMSLSVLMRVLPRALQSAGLLDKFDDVWEQIPQRGPLPGRLYERDNPIDPMASCNQCGLERSVAVMIPRAPG